MRRDTEIYKAQGAILGELADEAARASWIEAHGRTFRELWNADDAFRSAAQALDVAEMRRRIEEAERSQRS